VKSAVWIALVALVAALTAVAGARYPALAPGDDGAGSLAAAARR